MRVLILSACLVAAPAWSEPLPPPPCEHYAADLSKMVEADQAIRRRLDYTSTDKSALLRTGDQMGVVDGENTRRLKILIDQCGWPKRSVHGDKAAHDAWLLTQHADHDRAFQKKVIKLLEQAVAAGEAAPKSLAYLDDRVTVAENKPQRYGTQLMVMTQPCRLELSPVDDRAKVDERRKAIGLQPLDEYVSEGKRRACGQKLD